MQILEAHHYRLPACRFVLDLFDKKVLRQIVLEEEEQDENESSESESGEEESATNGMPTAG
jgi:rapamycin-insensitive companion of mTOR